MSPVHSQSGLIMPQSLYNHGLRPPFSDQFTQKVPDTYPADCTEHAFSQSQAAALTDRLDHTIFVSGILLSPLYSIQNLPTIASIPVLRTAGLLACAVDVTALVTSSAFRLRLKLLRGKGLDEGFAQNIAGSFSDRCLATASPLVLIAASMALLLASLSGSLFTAAATSTGTASFGAAECTMLGVGLAYALVHCGLVLQSVKRMGSCQPDHPTQSG